MYIPNFFPHQFSLQYMQTYFNLPTLFVQPQKAFPAGKSSGTLMFTVTIFHFKHM